MSRYDYTPNERIVDRAVALWVAMLSNPKYDNLGDNSPEKPESIFANRMAGALAASLPKNNTSDVLQKFGVALRDVMLNGYTGKLGDQPDYKFGPVSYFSVDYGPDGHLRAAAERAGLEMEFPWKTTMSLTAEYVAVGYGYGAPYVYHYPLSDGRWFEARLSGPDIKLVIAAVEAGVLGLDLMPVTQHVP